MYVSYSVFTEIYAPNLLQIYLKRHVIPHDHMMGGWVGGGGGGGGVLC